MSTAPNRTSLFVDDFCASTQQNHSNAFIILPSSGVMKQFLSSRYAALTNFKRNASLYCSRCERLLQFRIPQSGCECRKAAAKGKVTLIQDEISCGRATNPKHSTATSFGNVLLRSILPSSLLRRCSLFSAHCNDLQIHEHLEQTTLLQIVTRSRLETYCGKMYFDAIMTGLGRLKGW